MEVTAETLFSIIGQQHVELISLRGQVAAQNQTIIRFVQERKAKRIADSKGDELPEVIADRMTSEAMLDNGEAK